MSLGGHSELCLEVPLVPASLPVSLSSAPWGSGTAVAFQPPCCLMNLTRRVCPWKPLPPFRMHLSASSPSVLV